MKQILQNLRTGATELADVPCPALPPGHLLIATTRSLVSAGTERMLVDFGKASLIEKARQQPDKVKMVLDKMRTDGLIPTLEAVRNKLDQPLALGYCNIGRVLEVGRGATGFEIGDRVASNGRHAEIVSVPANLCVKVPNEVADEDAAFTVLGAIALQGIRLAQPTLGEAIAVTGLGLIGLVAVQLLRAHGCRVLGLDLDPERLALARQLGAEVFDLSAGADPRAAAMAFSRGNGMDGVIITAATRSSEPVHQAALMCRKRGRIVLVGVTGLELSRADFYEKELTFQVSCSYGPGRYDTNYEQKGLDYPISFVRWTEQRNFEAVLDMLADGRLNVQPLISHKFSIDEAGRAYAVIGGTEPSLGVMIRYGEGAAADRDRHSRTVRLVPAAPAIARNKRCAVTLGVIGSGNYAGSVLIPAFKNVGARLRTVVSSGGVSSLHLGRKHGFESATTDIEAVLADDLIDTIVVATRHDSHAGLIVKALAAGKHVFVEKPLALTMEEIEAIDEACCAARGGGRTPLVMIGFNRRFAPHTLRMKALLEGQCLPKAMVMTVNAGAVPADHWTQDADIGGGRIIGEACHFIDLLRHLAGSPITTHYMQPMASQTGDSATIILGFADGSTGAIHYFANGNKALPKERLEIFTAGKVLQLDNFRALTGHGWERFSRMRLWRQDKGQRACAAAFIEAIRSGGGAPIAYDEIIEVSRVTLALGASSRGAAESPRP